MGVFYERLNKLGFNNYNQYLNSNYWKDAKLRYKEAELPDFCLGCSNPKFQLHHRSYVRLGSEWPEDLIPLCGKCHLEVHDYLKIHKTQLSSTHTVLRKIKGWTRKKTRVIFTPFRKTRKGYGYLKTPIDYRNNRFNPNLPSIKI